MYAGTWGGGKHSCTCKQLQMMSCDEVQKEKEHRTAEVQMGASRLHGWSWHCHGGGASPSPTHRASMMGKDKLLFLRDWANSVACHLGVLSHTRVSSRDTHCCLTAVTKYPTRSIIKEEGLVKGRHSLSPRGRVLEFAFLWL